MFVIGAALALAGALLAIFGLCLARSKTLIPLWLAILAWLIRLAGLATATAGLMLIGWAESPFWGIALGFAGLTLSGVLAFVDLDH